MVVCCVKVEVKVTTVVAVENVELGVADREQVAAAKVTKYVKESLISACLPWHITIVATQII